MTHPPVSDFSIIDLDRHAFIEASAGTGKTYTIENLVLRLLLEKEDVSIENILLVTFTEKAACELKIRLREKLEKYLTEAKAGDALIHRKVQKALDAFDMAAISTIHGFCHRILSELAFENGVLLSHEVVDDGELYERLLKEQMRAFWPKSYGPHLCELLEISGFSANPDRVLEKIVRIARFAFRPQAGDRLLPELENTSYAQLRGRIISLLAELKTQIGPAPEFSEGFGKLNIHASTKKSLLRKIVIPLEEYFSDPAFSPEDLMTAAGLIHEIGSVPSGERKGAACLIPEKWSKAGPNLAVCPCLSTIVKALSELDELLALASHLIAVQSIHRLQADVAQFKRRKGWISYDDMLSKLDNALYGKRAEGLLAQLRARYRIAFVDEFQDTDPIQWRIFSRIFQPDPAPGAHNPLILIGDPKQAIYAFRGADVFTYLEAKIQIQQLEKEKRGNIYSLSTNWRSLPTMVRHFNTVFAQPTWFGKASEAASFDIGYEDSDSPHESELPLGLTKDGSRRGELNILDLRSCRTVRGARVKLAGFIASEIRYLVQAAGIVLSPRNETERGLDYGDICILVRGKADMDLLEPELAARGIPYSFYKKPGLFQSEAAEALSLMFHAILDPLDLVAVKKALLTPFFNGTVQDIQAYDQLSATHPVRKLLLSLQQLARQRKWGALFQSLWEDSGLLFRQSSQPDWDRTFTHFNQIFEHLQIMGHQLNLDSRGLCAYLDACRNQTASVDTEANLHPIETEERRVQIMTMHVSKGLQFPVVFIAGGLTRPFMEDYHICHHTDCQNPLKSVQKLIDLTGTAFKPQHELEKNQEEKRLFYVALTRAQIKLYLPYYPIDGQAAWIGPLAGFVAASIRSAFPQDLATDGVTYLSVPASFPASAKEAGRIGLPEMNVEDSENIYNMPKLNDYRHRLIRLESFSSLHAEMSAAAQNNPPVADFLSADLSARDPDEDETPAALIASSAADPDSADELPAGTEIGSMFHAILEQIDFQKVSSDPDQLLILPDTRNLIDGCLHQYRIDEKWRPLISRIIVNTLTTPIPLNGQSLLLGELTPQQRVHEAEFFFPCDLSGHLAGMLTGVHHRAGYHGFIRGYIDLIFQFRGKFYLADWKSNRLSTGYDQTALAKSMDLAGYHLQYRVYSLALMRWMRQFIKENEALQENFGGVVYLYLRGIGTGPGCGVYYVPPQQIGPLAALEQELTHLLKIKEGRRKHAS
jgi:exodeoxyribonuclease V beta subunit